MNYRHRLGTRITKIIGSFMTIAFVFVAFAHGQSCHLLPGWNPSTLADGASRTGYQIPAATYTQSCADSVGIITCVSWSIANNLGNVYPYASCTPHIWGNCTTPIAALHLDYKTLYKANHNSLTQTCQQLSQSLQCLDSHFTWGITPSLYTFASCTDQPRSQCVDNRTSPASYKDHGETLIGYTAKFSIPGDGTTCALRKKTLTCTNGNWLWGNQSSLFTGCIDSGSFQGCANQRNNTIIPHGSSVNAYTSPQSVGTWTCTTVLRPLSCTNGIWSGNGTAQQNGLYSWCVQANTAPCANIIDGTGTVLHGTFITKYTHPLANQTNNESCSAWKVPFQCVNGNRVGGSAGIYTWCQTVTSWSCLDDRSHQYIPHLQFIYGYTSQTPTSTLGCDGVKKQLLCKNNLRYTSGTQVNQSTLYGSCSSCILPRWTPLAEWNFVTWYSSTWASLPKKCAVNYAERLTCTNGVIGWNWQTYNNSGCIDEYLFNGVDLTINESVGLPGQENIDGGVIAQWSSPQIGIVFKNKWDTVFDGTAAAWFLTCMRVEKNLPVYTSNPITSLVVNTWTKVGVNIRISSLFTQSITTKNLKCTIDTSKLTNTINSNAPDNIAVPGNNIWSWSFEVVEASRFDLALSKSIESISKNLESAEGAKWAQWLQNFLYNKIMNVVVPIVIVLWILSAILWFYKIMFSTEDTATKEWTRYIIYGVIGILLIMSAKFIGQNVYDILINPDIKWNVIAVDLYNNILYPFIKFAIYLVLGAMFVILVTRVITFLFGTDADAQKKAGTLIWWNVISMIIIIGAKQIVEAIYGTQQNVVKDITNLWEVGSGILENKNIPILYQVINYALWMASLVILVIIIVQTVKLLMKPDDPAQVKSIKSSLLYMFIGILVLGAGYLIVNFAIIN